MIRVNKTKKNSKKDFIVAEKYVKSILGVDTRLYKIKLNNDYPCRKKLTLKKTINPIVLLLKKNKKLINSLTNKKKVIKKFEKNSSLNANLIKFIEPYEKYTYCLYEDTVVIAENKTKFTKKVKDYSSKHYVMCKENAACASGELVIKHNSFIFDNSSGTFEPSLTNLQFLKRALPFLNVKIMTMDMPLHSKFFGGDE
jgi:hypothetical protein